MAASPNLPTVFPCYVRAVFSYTAETKNDLGFVEGDLIECLNAGDGSWWMGRSWRDKRMKGLFPSNFVQVLSPDFRPSTKSSTTLPNRSPSTSPFSNPQAPTQTKSKAFRKPFTAYAAPDAGLEKRTQLRKQPSVRRSPSPAPRGGYDIQQPEPDTHNYGPRAHSPAPPRQNSYSSRAPSPAPSRHNSYNHRAPSPVPPRQNSYSSRAPSPGPSRNNSYNHRAPSPIPPMHNEYSSRGPSPAPPAQLYRAPSPIHHTQVYRAYSPVPPRNDSYDRAPSPGPSRNNSYNHRAPSPVPPRDESYNYRAPSPSPYRAYSPVPPRNNSYGSRAPSPGPLRHDSYRAHSPAPPIDDGYNYRATSPAPPMHNGYNYRAPSPAPPAHNGYGSRAPSPAPPIHHGYGSRAPSPAPPRHNYDPRAPSPGPLHHYNRAPSPASDAPSSPPPPPPPPHRITYTQNAAIPSYNSQAKGYQTPRAVSPNPNSTGLTPSPLRNAMDDVMSSLAGMGMSKDRRTPSPPLDPWSPEAFDQTYIKASRRNAERPNTVIGVADYDISDDDGDQPYLGSSKSRPDAQPIELSNYVSRMEQRLNAMHGKTSSPAGSVMAKRELFEQGPAVPPKPGPFERPKSSMAGSMEPPKLRHRKSAFDVGRSMLGRTFTTKTSSTSSSSGNKSTTTNGSTSTTATDRSLMSGASASGMSYTSAGSLARKKEALHGRAQSAMGIRRDDINGSQSGFGGSVAGISYHSSHASDYVRPKSQAGWREESSSILGGLMAPKAKKSGFFKKIIETAKTGAASARSTIASGESPRTSPTKMSNGVSAISSGFGNTPASTASDMGLGGGNDWVQVRRDVNRSNSLSHIEMVEKRERCMMMDYPAINPTEEFMSALHGEEGADGQLVPEPTNFQAVNLNLVDKNARFVNSLPNMTNPASLATSFVCRPYRSDVQRLRAIFTWVTEKIIWEDGVDAPVDLKRVISTKRGSTEEVAILVAEMCLSVGIHCEVVRGYLKTPGEVPELSIMPRSNHWWNAVIVDDQWRVMDCSLASPSHPLRALYSSANSQYADFWYFLTRPTEICWTHLPEHSAQQHLCPSMPYEVLLALPCACPPFFKNDLQLVDYDTSLIRVEDLEMVQVKFTVPADVECAAEVEAKAFEKDSDGDFFESGDVVKKRALSQVEWIGGQRRYTVKALLPGDEGQGILKIYAGKKGLMQSIRDIPHPLAFALPIVHTGDNPEYEFLSRYPTPHAQRFDIYVAQPQCQRLVMNNTFVFAFRQHPASFTSEVSETGRTSPLPAFRPASAMSMNSSSAAGSDGFSSKSHSTKAAKMAIQTPGNKILRVLKKDEKNQSTSQGVEKGDGGTYEAIIKVTERGSWRGLVLADRSMRWCVFAEWQCV